MPGPARRCALANIRRMAHEQCFWLFLATEIQNLWQVWFGTKFSAKNMTEHEVPLPPPPPLPENGEEVDPKTLDPPPPPPPLPPETGEEVCSKTLVISSRKSCVTLFVSNTFQISCLQPWGKVVENMERAPSLWTHQTASASLPKILSLSKLKASVLNRCLGRSQMCAKDLFSYVASSLGWKEIDLPSAKCQQRSIFCVTGIRGKYYDKEVTPRRQNAPGSIPAV